MPTVLLTGSSGQVGRAVGPLLQARGWTVRSFDVADGDDLRHPASVTRAVIGCDAVVHAGAIAHDSAGTPAEIMATNVLGTWHVLDAAETAGVSRVVVFSSAQVFGFAEGEGCSAYLPVDDSHPLLAARPYGLSKRLVEEMCEAWTTRTGISTIVLRPVMIVNDDSVDRVHPSDADLGALVHAVDVALAVHSALTVEVGHVRLILAACGEYDTRNAADVLGWRPTRTWPTTSD